MAYKYSVERTLEMKRLVFILYILIASISLPCIAPTFAEGVNSENQPKSGISKQDARYDLSSEYERYHKELWKDYQKLRDELINGYLSEKLRMKYEELKLRQQELIDKYLEEKTRLLGKYFKDKEKENQQFTH